jgi:hypothetical protein
LRKFHFGRYTVFHWSVLFLSIQLALLQSCKQPDLGLEVQDPGDVINLLRTDSLSIQSTLEREDSVKSDELVYNLLGSYNDPSLGLINASVVSQFRPSVSNVILGEGFQADSLVLVLPLRSAYGDITKFNGLQTFKAYRLEESINLSDVYYSNKVVSVSSTPIGSIGPILPLLSDSVIVTGKKEGPQIRIPLDIAIANEIAANPSSLVGADAFLSLFKGVKITSELPFNQKGKGAILDLNLLSGARIDLFYKNLAQGDSLRISFVVNENAARFTQFNHQYSQQVDDLLNNPGLGQEYSFVQTMAGLRTKILFPNLLSWKAQRNILVNKARLFVPIDTSSIGIYPVNPQLNIITKSEDGTLTIIPDLLVSEDYAGSAFNSATKEYVFNITRYIQSILDGKAIERGLYIQAKGTGVSSFRVKINGGSNPTKPIRLELLYQILPSN